MSKLLKAVNSVISDFCDVIAKKYKLNKNDLFKLWDEESDCDTKSETSDTKQEIELTREKIMGSTKDMLMAYCKAKGLKQSGKKEEIVDRLLKSLSDTPSSSTSSTSTKAKPQKTAPVLDKIEKSTLEIRKNKFGNFEHFETGLLFNNETKTVTGKQNENGKIDSLTDHDIEQCKKFKFKYTLPDNLNVDKGLKNVKIEDEEEEEEEELDEDDLEEEEEDLENEIDLEED